MSELPLLASAYAVFLALVAALFTVVSRGQHPTAGWPNTELPRFRAVLARTLLVLAGLVLFVTALRHRTEPTSLASLGAAALVVGIVASRAAR